uniref:Acyltransferase 3 domain-containing protein n=1 Tax=Panagrolaimus davidi TaxID=227884 RepID=A0A914PJ70_9BILA
MAMILLSSNSLKETFFTTTLTFYYRRIYRILPLYLFNILFTLLIVPIASFTYVQSDLWPQTKSALTFSTNFAMLFEKHDYFNTGLLYYWYKHYWSLCVEMQFYAIVPFLLYFSKRLPLLISLFLIWPLIIGGCVFLIFYMLINYGQNGAQFTFTMLPARIYEFVGGFIAFHAQQAIDIYFDDSHKILLAIKKTINSVITVNILTLALLILALYPVKLIDVYTLPATIVLTAALIASIGRTKEKNEMKFSLLANKFCIFIGDASYSLYICHWIIVFLGKLIFGEDQQHKQLILIACFIFGIFVHLCIEKPIVEARLKPSTFFPWLIITYLAIGYVAYNIDYHPEISNVSKDLFHNKSMLIVNKTAWEDIILEIHPDISAEIGVLSWYDLCKTGKINDWFGNGSLKILLIGNSHALCIVPGIKLATKGMYSHLKLFTEPGLTPFEGFQYGRRLPELRQTVKDFKPDIIYLIFKYMDDFDEPTIGPVDFRVQTMQEMTDFLSQNSKVLFISKMHFYIPHYSSLKYAEQMYHNGWSKDYLMKQKVTVKKFEKTDISETARNKFIN